MTLQVAAPQLPPISSLSLLKTARIAGLLYLTVAICGGFAEIVRTALVDQASAGETAANILESEFLFRLSFAGDLVAFSADIALAALFYVLFKSVNEMLALLAAFFRLAQGAVLGINLLNQFSAILLLEGGDYLTAFEPEQLDALVLLSMNAHTYGYLIGLVFFGLSTFFLGLLVFTSGYFPKVLGIALMLFVPIGYLGDSFTSFLWSDHAEIISVVLIAPATITELAFVAWLLLRGARSPRLDPAYDA